MKAILKTEDLKRLIKATAKFISKDENRHALHWIKLTFHKDTLTAQAVAIDGYRVSVESVSCLSVIDSFTVYIKPYLPVKAKDKVAEVCLSDGKCLINIGGNMTGYVQPDIKYLDDNKIISDIEALPVLREVLLSKEFLTDALNSLLPDSPSSRQTVMLQLREDHQPVSIRSGESVRYVLPCRK